LGDRLGIQPVKKPPLILEGFVLVEGALPAWNNFIKGQLNKNYENSPANNIQVMFLVL